MMTRLLLAAAALLAPAPAFAANNVQLTSEVLRERTVVDAKGVKTTVYEAPKLVVPGDRLLFVLGYRNAGTQPATDFVVTNPLPAQVVFEEASGKDARVSVDGGKTWGPLASLKVRAADGSFRAATAADVTHVRWQLANAIPIGGTGKVSFRGLVK